MESFIQDFIINSTLDDELTEGLLERRLSPYATLRAGDLTALLRVQSALPPLVNSILGNHGNDNIISSCKTTQPSIEADFVLEGQNDDFYNCSTADNENDVPERRKTVDIICRGDDTNNSPAEYTMKGLHHHEMPVIGVCVDKRICVGFKYSVRRVGDDKYLFNDIPKVLLSIGMGYGKRLTFSGDNLNNNECYFWSDSEQDGYAFSIRAVDVAQKFSILDDDNVIVGEGIVESIDGTQEEMSTDVTNGVISKQVKVTLTCSMKYYQRHNHGLLEMMVNEDTETISGVALLTKSKRSKTANLIAIEQVFLQRFGICKLEPDL